MMRKTIVAVFGLMSIGFLGACGDDGGATTPSATTPTATVAVPTTTAAGTATTTVATAAGTVKLSDSKLGKILTDDAGRTLYLFTNDTKGKNNCAGACASTWPVYAPSAISASTGIDATKLASIDSGGKKQVTIDGVPLYYFSGDSKAGDINGQGVGGVWFVVDATGKAVK